MTAPRSRTTDLLTPRGPHAIPTSGMQSLPRLTTTVPREYVHRACHAEVFLTGCEKLDEDHFALSGEWPRIHPFFTSADGRRHDALQAAETIRQTGLFLAHAEFDVPLGHQFLLSELYLTTFPDNMVTGHGPSELSLTATCTDMIRRGKRLAEFTMNITIERDNRPCATGGGRFACISDGTYRRLRGTATTARLHTRTQPKATLTPATVGKTAPADVVLAATALPGHYLLDPDPRHATLFEHAGDHYPGMVLLEAAWQAATAHTHPQARTPTSVHAQFHRYAEFTTPVWITATPHPNPDNNDTTLTITATQQNHTLFTATTTTPPTTN
ncbi:ScbA/BarX family gamma-butyrolactone biosynthesis protein [Streptomyces sp. NPDC089424]|uniref:ScbA/BarX family gamma-butyrolactone biosynthesis protein n=1 Tax=Streptomyces sp. NPDC089424 TaxID=3365917 RepID=UPI0037F97EFB